MKPTRPLLVAAAFALLLAFALPGPSVVAQQQDESAPKPANLRPQWNEGQAARYHFWSKTQKTESAAIRGQTRDERTTFVTEGEMRWRVDSVQADGSATCTMKLETIKFTITNDDNEPMVIDSENPAGEQAVFESLVAAMVSTPLTVSVNADGSIAGVKGIDQMKNAAGQEARDAEIIPEELDFIETASELATLIAAPAAATPGQTWNTKNKWNHDSVIPGTDTIGQWDTTFTYDGVGEIAGVPIATIKTSSNIDMKVDLSKLPEQSPDIDVQIGDASAKGEILFDLSRHETVARNDSMAYTATITVTPPTNQIPPIQINVTQTSQSQLLRIAEE